MDIWQNLISKGFSLRHFNIFVSTLKTQGQHFPPLGQRGSAQSPLLVNGKMFSFKTCIHLARAHLISRNLSKPV